MPTVPRYVQTERPRGYQNVQPLKGGQIVAGAWQQAGKALQGAGNTLNDMALDMQRRQNEAVAREAMTAYEDLRHTFWNGVIENRKGKNALGDQNSKDVITQAAEWQRDIVASLLEHKTEWQKRLLTEYFQKRGLSLQDQAQHWQQRQWDEYEAGAAKAFQQAQLQRAVDDPAQMSVAMANYATSVLTFNRGRGVSDEATSLQVQEGWDKAGKAVVRQFLQGEDLKGASRTLDQYENDLSPSTVRELRAEIRKQQEAMRTRAEANLTKAGKAIMKGYADAEYQAKNMGDVSTLEKMAADLGKLGLTDEAEKCRNAAETWRGMEDISKLSLPELAQKIEAATGSLKAEKDVDTHKRLSTQSKAMLDVYNIRLKALNSDPAQAADTAPDLALPDQPSEADKFAARMEWQKKNGVPADMAVPLTKGEAGYLGQQYTQSAQPVQFLAAMRTTYGDMYQPVLKQLVTSGAIPPTANLVADMEPEAGQYLAQASRKDYEKETETALGIEKADKNAMKTKLQGELADIIGTLAAFGDAAAGSRILDAGYRLALRYRELGMDADDATEKAAQDVFASRYTVRGSYRVPKRFNDDDVDAGAQAYVENLDTSDILVGLSDEAKAMKPEALALLMRRTIALSGRWVTNRDESGLILTVGGAPVRLKSGGRVEVTFEELEHLGLTGSEE